MMDLTDYAIMYRILNLATFLWGMNCRVGYADDYFVYAKDRMN